MALGGISALTLESMRVREKILSDFLIRTPTIPLNSSFFKKIVSKGQLFCKLECHQHTNTFKARGALSVVLGIPMEKRQFGITAASAGNHAIASAWAAFKLGMSAKVVMQSTANPFRVAKAEAFGAEVIFKDKGAAIFKEAERLSREENRTFIHPFEGIQTSQGTSGVGLELMDDIKDLDAVVVSVGGGGLIGGVAAAVKNINPECQVYGVEPVGANSMFLSLKAGKPITLKRIETIADSLAPPMTLPLSYSLCEKYVDKIVLLDDDEICAGMVLALEEMKLALEPAAAATVAALVWPLRSKLKDKKSALVICGSNIDVETYKTLLLRGQKKLDKSRIKI